MLSKDYIGFMIVAVIQISTGMLILASLNKFRYVDGSRPLGFRWS